MNRMTLCVGEIMELAAWVEKQGLKRTHRVEVEQDNNSGIGTSTVAKIRMTEDSGIFKDITDFDLW
jgi:hypothetical protein